uniref:Uncharacterized protein n=1 Tax=Parascaris univalens TaxID=6257 RepID=A0A915CKQ2_PARUN
FPSDFYFLGERKPENCLCERLIENILGLLRVVFCYETNKQDKQA